MSIREISEEMRCPLALRTPPSKWETYGFAIAIIVGVGIGSVGLIGYFQVGALSNLTQVDAIILMATGWGGGFILSIIGVVRRLKSQNATIPSEKNNPEKTIKSDPKIALDKKDQEKTIKSDPKLTSESKEQKKIANDDPKLVSGKKSQENTTTNAPKRTFDKKDQETSPPKLTSDKKDEKKALPSGPDVTLDSLPQDIQNKIFSSLTPNDLLKIAQVNKEFNRIVQDDSFWQSLCLDLGSQNKDPSINWKTHYFEFCKPYYVGNQETKKIFGGDLMLERPKEVVFYETAKKIANFTLLSNQEIKDLVRKQTPFCVGVALPSNWVKCQQIGQIDTKTLRYVARQKVGKATFEIFSFNTLFFSFDAQYQLLVKEAGSPDFKPTGLFYTEDDCQFIILSNDSCGDEIWVQRKKGSTISFDEFYLSHL